MATRLPRCFAAAAATASAAAAASGTTSGNPNTSQASSRRRCNVQGEEQEQSKARRDGLPTTSAEKVGYAPSSASHYHSGGNNVRPSIGALRPEPPTWKEALASIRLGRVAYADAAAGVASPSLVEGGEGGAGGDAMMPSLEEGEKPEFIQRADAQAEQMRQQLRRPSQFPDQFGEVSQLTQVHSFDGFRLDMSKAITPTFFTSHNIFFGNSQFPVGHYQGTLTVVGENDTMVRASMDAEGNVSMDLHAPLGLPTLTGKVTVRQGKNEVLQGTAVYSGDTWVGQVSAGTEPIDVCYNQAVTQRLSIGGQGQFSAAQQAVGLLYGFKYNTPSWAVLGRFIGGGANVVTAQYLRRVVPGRVNLAAEYQTQIGAGSQMMLGAEFVLKQSKMSASVDSNGKVDSALELKCGTFPTLPVTVTLSSSLDHAEDKHTFGLALTCGQ